MPAREICRYLPSTMVHSRHQFMFLPVGAQLLQMKCIIVQNKQQKNKAQALVSNIYVVMLNIMVELCVQTGRTRCEIHKST